jgi:phosphoribosyl 1,2-cyclic phosphate phosphodiesterase
MRVTVLGCGGSGGVPLLGDDWGSCSPANPRNRRRRVSVLVEAQGQKILIDASPDLREQLLDAKVAHLDAVLFTHDHADHTHGIDDLRFLRRDRGAPPLDAYGTKATLASIAQRFDYIFRQSEEGSGTLYRPFLAAREVDGPFCVGAVAVVPFDQDHGMGTVSTGYRVGGTADPGGRMRGGMAYSTDVVGLSAAALAELRDLDLWIVDCLRFEPHPTHAHVDRALTWIERLKPRRAILTHMNHMTDYDALAQACPPGVEPGYDGLVVEVAG